jgi:hypothetical protein
MENGMLLQEQESEGVLFRNKDILVSRLHLEIGDTAYSMQSIKDVWAERDDPSIFLPLVTLLLGLAGLCWGLLGPDETMWLSFGAGGGVIGFGFVSLLNLRPTFAINLRLASAETLSLIVTEDGREAEALLLALQKSLVFTANAAAA